MSKLALVIVMMLMAGRNNAQNDPASNNEPQPCYFVLIQSDNGQPFYVRVNNRIYSSSSAGHLILSQLKDSIYPIAIGFPGQPATERRYLLNVRQRDWVLYLARQGKTWGLYDKQEQELPSAVDTAAIGRPPLSGVKKDDPFSQMMSAIVQDTAVMYNTYASTSTDTLRSAAESRGTSPSAAESRGTPPSANISPDTSTAILASSRVTNPAFSGTALPSGAASSSATPAFGGAPSSPTGVVKLVERRSANSLTLVYMDHAADKGSDTIDVLIPVKEDPSPLLKPETDTLQSTAPFIGWNSERDSATGEAMTPHKTRLPFVNSDCHAFATEYDVDKLRVRMLDAAKDDDRIQTAYKTFKTKCFTTRQIRALSEVFATDAARFKFLETAYPFVSDDHFVDLGNLFSEPVYIDKFRSMTSPH
ncbi:MAG TPA: DUF4476 domain-containing protein [Puia sp.]|nr:DUF4476 domain-containing protein [Puia sp.]